MGYARLKVVIAPFWFLAYVHLQGGCTPPLIYCTTIHAFVPNEVCILGIQVLSACNDDANFAAYGNADLGAEFEQKS